MSENTSNGPATPEPEPGGGLNIPSAQSLWVGIINAVRNPLSLLALLALISFTLLAYLFSDSDFRDSLESRDLSSIIQILGYVILGIVAIIGIYVFRGGPLLGGERKIGKPGDVIHDANGLETVQGVLDELARNTTIQSSLPVAVMSVMDQDKDVPTVQVRRLSEPAKIFFGFDVTARIDSVVGKSVGDLIRNMTKYLNPPTAYFADLGQDQDRVMKELLQEEPTYARLPFRFNKGHRAFKNKTFVPIITERREVGEGEDRLTVLRVLYLDVAELPKNIFSDRVWQEVIKDIIPETIAKDLKRIQKDLDKRYFCKDDDGGEFRRKALDDAIENLEKGGSPAVLDDLSKAGWFVLREEAQNEAQGRPEKPQVLNLIDAILS